MYVCLPEVHRALILIGCRKCRRRYGWLASSLVLEGGIDEAPESEIKATYERIIASRRERRTGAQS